MEFIWKQSSNNTVQQNQLHFFRWTAFLVTIKKSLKMVILFENFKWELPAKENTNSNEHLKPSFLSVYTSHSSLDSDLENQVLWHSAVAKPAFYRNMVFVKFPSGKLKLSSAMGVFTVSLFCGSLLYEFIQQPSSLGGTPVRPLKFFFLLSPNVSIFNYTG